MYKYLIKVALLAALLIGSFSCYASGHYEWMAVVGEIMLAASLLILLAVLFTLLHFFRRDNKFRIVAWIFVLLSLPVALPLRGSYLGNDGFSIIAALPLICLVLIMVKAIRNSSNKWIIPLYLCMAIFVIAILIPQQGIAMMLHFERVWLATALLVYIMVRLLKRRDIEALSLIKSIIYALIICLGGIVAAHAYDTSLFRRYFGNSYSLGRETWINVVTVNGVASMVIGTVAYYIARIVKDPKNDNNDQ